MKVALILAASYSLSFSPRPTRYHLRRVLLALILVASYSLPYSSRLTRSHTRRVLLAIILAASYSLSYSSRPTRSHTRHLLLAPILVTSYSLSYSPCPTRYRPCRRRPDCHPPHSRRAHRVVLIVVVLNASCSSRRVYRAVLIASGSSHRVVFANFPLFPSLSNATRIKNSGDGCDAGCLCWKCKVW